VEMAWRWFVGKREGRVNEIGGVGKKRFGEQRGKGGRIALTVRSCDWNEVGGGSRRSASVG